jgi:peptidoglycan-N-acetylglucosamine deacetylase
MLRGTVTRFHLTAAAAALCALGGLMFAKPWLVGVALAAFAVAMAFGVSLCQWSFFGPFVCAGPTSRSIVALTFDDGPDPRSTPALLDWLRDQKLSASFFCIGRHVAAHPELAQRIVREGHSLQNHTFHHSNATNFLPRRRLVADIAQAQDAAKGVTGRAPTLFRPPMGLSNPNTFRAARELGLKVIGWTARGFDTQVRQPERVVARILRQVRPGAIILLHDGGIPAERLLETMRLLLDGLRARGYEVVRLEELLNEKAE